MYLISVYLSKQFQQFNALPLPLSLTHSGPALEWIFVTNSTYFPQREFGAQSTLCVFLELWVNQLHSTAFEAYKLQSSFLREYLTRNPEKTTLLDSEVVVLCRNSGTWKILDYFLLYFEALVYTYILVSGFSAPLLWRSFGQFIGLGFLLACWGFFKRKKTECLHHLNSTSSHKSKNPPCSCRPGYKISCSLQPTGLSVGWLCIATSKQFGPQWFECLDVLKGDEESIASLKVALVAPFQTQELFCVCCCCLFICFEFSFSSSACNQTSSCVGETKNAVYRKGVFF